MIQWMLVFYIFQEHSGAELILPTSSTFSGTMKELATLPFNTDLFLAHFCKPSYPTIRQSFVIVCNTLLRRRID